MPILVKPAALVDLNHRASLFGGFSEASGYAIASEQGSITIISPDLRKQVTIKRPEKLQSISIHPAQPLLAVVEGRESRLSFVDLSASTDDTTLADADDTWDWTGNPPTWNDNLPGACLFGPDGRCLWYAATRSDGEIEIQIVEYGTWRVLSKTVFKDPYGHSHLSFYGIGITDEAALWIAGYQDGQQIYWLKRDGNRVSYKPQPDLEFTTPPIFSPSCRQFIVYDAAELIKYEFPDVNRLSTYHWPKAKGWREGFGPHPRYIDEQRVLICSHESCLFLFDLMDMAVLDEVLIEGHEPKPVRVYTSNATEDNRFCTDIEQLERLGDMLLFSFKRKQEANSDGWQDSLPFVPIPALIAQIEGAD